MDQRSMLEDYARTEAALRRRISELRAAIKEMPFPERDATVKRLAVMQEELSDVVLTRLELTRREQIFS